MADLLFDINTSTLMKKNIYRKYLVDSGIIDKLSTILSKLIDLEIRPEDPMIFIRRELGDIDRFEEEKALEQELDDARREICRLKTILSNNGIKVDEDDSNKIPKGWHPPGLLESFSNKETYTAIVKQEPLD